MRLMSECSLTPAAVRTLVDTKLAQTGEKERLKDLLRSRLTESGWREDMKQQIKEYINKKEGNVTMDELVRECGTIGVGEYPIRGLSFFFPRMILLLLFRVVAPK